MCRVLKSPQLVRFIVRALNHNGDFCLRGNKVRFVILIARSKFYKYTIVLCEGHFIYLIWWFDGFSKNNSKLLNSGFLAIFLSIFQCSIDENYSVNKAIATHHTHPSSYTITVITICVASLFCSYISCVTLYFCSFVAWLVCCVRLHTRL